MCLFIFSLDDRQSLNKWCDQLINFEVTREELLESHELEVDSTTENKSAPLKKKRKVLVEPEAGTKKNTQLVGAMAAKSRASEIFKAMSPASNNDEKIGTPSDKDSADVLSMKEQLQQQQQLIFQLQKELSEKCK